MIPRQLRHSMRGSAAGFCLLLLLLFPFSSAVAQKDYTSQITQLFARDSVTIVITDSGLGGLSVCADLDAQLSRSGPIRSARLIFVNALPDLAHTYNSMASVEEQSKVFDGVLSGINERYHPDAILIACNTLSAVYPKTAFVKNTTVPVVSIIDVGSKMIADGAKKSASSRLLLLGTPTTIESGIYEKQLSALGIPQNQIISQPCKFLETEIQADPKSDIVNNLIETYVDEATEKLGAKGKGPISVGLCCSHYSYSLNAFTQLLRQKLGTKFELLNPNKAMAALFSVPIRTKTSSRTKTSVEVVSRVQFTGQEINSIASALNRTSRKTAEALRHYQHKEDLFPFRN